jgi:hypothetical protein
MEFTETERAEMLSDLLKGVVAMDTRALEYRFECAKNRILHAIREDELDLNYCELHVYVEAKSELKKRAKEIAKALSKNVRKRKERRSL